MKKITLEIKAEDIMSSRYLICGDCAITRALHRAGYKDYRDSGIHIIDRNSKTIVAEGNRTYDALANKVIGMYSHKDGKEYTNGEGVVEPIEPVDFTHELIF